MPNAQEELRSLKLACVVVGLLHARRRFRENQGNGLAAVAKHRMRASYTGPENTSPGRICSSLAAESATDRRFRRVC